MSPDAFRQWLETMNYTAKKAGAALDYSERQINSFSTGKQDVPPCVEYSCYYLLSLKFGRVVYSPSIASGANRTGIVLGDEILPAPPTARA